MKEPNESSNLNDPTFWDRNSDYRTIANDFTAFYSEQAWELAALPQNARVLDIAAGAGALTRVAANAGNSVLATDFSEGMIDAIIALGLPRVEARVMDGHALAIPDDSFDAAFSMFGIMLFEDWNQGLSEMVRVLKPGGTACIGTWKEPSGAAANLLLATIAEWRFPDLEPPEVAPGMVEWTDRGDFVAALERAGLGELRFHVATRDFNIDIDMLRDPERLFQFSPIWPLLSQMQRSELSHELSDLARRNNGRIDVASPATIAIGTKVVKPACNAL